VKSHNIVILTSVFPVGSVATNGIFVYKIAHYLKIHYKVRVCLTVNQFSYFKLLKAKKDSGLHTQFSLTVLPYISFGVIWFFRVIPQLISAFFSGLFLLPLNSKTIYYGKFNFGAVLSVLFAKATGGFSVGDFGESNFMKSSSFYPDFVLKFVFKNIDAAICLNQNIFNKVKGIRENSDGIYLLHNGVDLEVFRPFTGAMNPSNVLRCLFVGHFIPRKGVSEASAAISLSGNIGNFIGSGPLEPSGLHVLSSSCVDHRELPSHLQNADIFVFPSYNEGSPNALIEAISSGLPVVGWDLPFMREHTTPEFAILVSPGDVAGLSEAIKFISDNLDVRIQMSICARSYACSHFSLACRNKKILKILSHLD